MAMATLALRRKGRVLGHRHAWQILLDGKPNGSIADDDAIATGGAVGGLGAARDPAFPAGAVGADQSQRLNR